MKERKHQQETLIVVLIEDHLVSLHKSIILDNSFFLSSGWYKVSKYNREMEIDEGFHHHFQFRVEEKKTPKK